MKDAIMRCLGFAQRDDEGGGAASGEDDVGVYKQKRPSGYGVADMVRYREITENNPKPSARVSDVVVSAAMQKLAEPRYSRRSLNGEVVLSQYRRHTPKITPGVYYYLHRSLSRTDSKCPPEEKYGFIIPPTHTLKLLMVFPSMEGTADALKRAAEKLGFDVKNCCTHDKALEEFQTVHQDLIIIDSRSKALDFDTLCRSIRSTKGSQHIVLASVVKKSAFEKDDNLIMSHLEIGFNRCLVESINVISWYNELMQLKTSDCRNAMQIGTNQIMYKAMNGTRDPVIVMDDIGRLQYLNGASERLFGYRVEETLGKTIQTQLAGDPNQIQTLIGAVTKGKTWQGLVAFKRKAMDTLNTTCKAFPIVCAGRTPTHILLIIDTFGPAEGYMNQSRGSINSMRKSSVDFKNTDYGRRTSLAKLPLEAPITKIINLIYDVQVQSSPVAGAMLEKVVDMLKCTELYSPSVKEEAKGLHEEPVASNLIEALLSQHASGMGLNSRRSSNDSSIYRATNKALRIKPKVDKLLENVLDWDFNVFKLESLTEHRPLVNLGEQIMSHYDVHKTLGCDERTMYNWLLKIEANYHSSNPYHNSAHAADVLQAVAVFLTKDRLRLVLDPIDQATALIAAAAHDVDHPGRSSAFLANSANPLAILYNDITVLESHHAACTFKLTLNDDKCNIFKRLDRETYNLVRFNIVDMILATEMTKHFEHLAKFVNVFCTQTAEELEEVLPEVLSAPENITLIKRIMIKCADVSNPTRSLPLCIEWSKRIAEEYFQQTEEEQEKSLPVVMPLFNRGTCSVPKAQIGFMDFIINNMMDAWHAFIDMPELVTNMRKNYLAWKEMDDQGCSTLSDISKMQETTWTHRLTY
ncbi:high affinity cAMP-specific and IBMX-insensitive 3',5'-cyclic phosphodiesterase 8-like isoform X3 [Atheta coriaria]|uniref:high affinity cAMP-specific and IBMX-insensitive 3',5'-cyclic phosphodiesterase 8-like isoform X3 n=1 Tax=Dalotia coriaria TaxID=877792 RepID=UPI0031F34E55